MAARNARPVPPVSGERQPNARNGTAMTHDAGNERYRPLPTGTPRPRSGARQARPARAPAAGDDRADRREGLPGRADRRSRQARARLPADLLQPLRRQGRPVPERLRRGRDDGRRGRHGGLRTSSARTSSAWSRRCARGPSWRPPSRRRSRCSCSAPSAPAPARSSAAGAARRARAAHARQPRIRRPRWEEREGSPTANPGDLIVKAILGGHPRGDRRAPARGPRERAPGDSPTN